MADEKKPRPIPNLRQVMLSTPEEAALYWPSAATPGINPLDYGTVQVPPIGDTLRQWYSRGVAPYVDPIVSGAEAGGIPGALGGGVRSLGLGAQSLYDTFISNPAAQLEQWLPLGTLGEFGPRLMAGLSGEPMPQAAAAAAPPPAAPPPPQMPALQQPSVPSFYGPMVNYGYNAPQFPEMAPGPDFAAAAPQQAPQNPDALLGAMLQGLYAGAGNTHTLASPSQLLFNLGMGALGGKGQYIEQQQARADAFQGEQNAFQRWLAQQQQEQAALQTTHGINKAQFEAGNAQAQAQLRARQMEQLQPKITGNHIITPTQEGGRIRYDVQSLPDKSLQYAQYLVRPNDVYDTILSSPGGVEALTEISKNVDPKLAAKFAAVGASDKTISDTSVAQLVQAFAQSYPEEYQLLLQEAMFRRALGGK